MGNAPQAGPVRFGQFEIDLNAGELRKNGIKIKLSDSIYVFDYESPALWDSDKVTAGDINALLPDSGGRTMSDSQSFSLLSPKAVQHNSELSYYAP